MDPSHVDFLVKVLAGQARATPSPAAPPSSPQPEYVHKVQELCAAELESVFDNASGPMRPEFVVHDNSPLALLKKHEREIFAPLLPWLYCTFKHGLLLLFCDRCFTQAHLVSDQQKQRAVESILTLPFMCFRIGSIDFSDQIDPFAAGGTRDPFAGAPPEGVERQWTRVAQLDMLLAMRLVNEYVAKTQDEQRGGYEGLLQDEVLDRRLPVEWELREATGVRLHAVYRPEEPDAKSEARAVYRGPLTLRKLIGMLMDMPFVGPGSDALLSRYVYVEDASQSTYFVIHRAQLGERIKPLQWQVVVRSPSSNPPRPDTRNPLPGATYSPRLLLFDVMRDLNKRYEEAAMLRGVMGPGGAI